MDKRYVQVQKIVSCSLGQCPFFVYSYDSQNRVILCTKTNPPTQVPFESDGIPESCPLDDWVSLSDTEWARKRYRNRRGWFKDPQGITNQISTPNATLFRCMVCGEEAQIKAPRVYTMANKSGIKYRIQAECVCGTIMEEAR